MLKKTLSLILLTSALVFIFNACNEVNSPQQDSFLADQNNSFETIDSDLFLLQEGGMDIDAAAGIFSIGWNEIFRPFHDESEVVGMAFAVAFGEPNDRHRFGINMGSVFINYGDHSVELHKRANDFRGVMYTLFRPPFGHSDRLLKFIPQEEYQFEVTGSDGFSQISFSLISPSELIDITSHKHGDVIDHGQDLTVTWEGGDPHKKVALRLMPFFRRHNDHRDNHRRHPDQIIFVILDSNPGHYTFTAKQIQELLKGTDTRHFVLGVSQMDFGEVEHKNGILRTAMRNGNSVMLNIE
ncbi:MAG: hypothetical protein IIA49_05675 [Bacteroidetes bacterium]|nr:hypothetical protein [Bacteroidota bacterium]